MITAGTKECEVGSGPRIYVRRRRRRTCGGSVSCHEVGKEGVPGSSVCSDGTQYGILVVRAYAKEHDQELDALIVCGSPSKNYLRPLGAAVGHAEAAVLGDEHRSNLLEAMSFGSFAARFADEKSRFAWCCSDPEVVREYEENPLCGFTFSDDAFFALNDLLKETYGFHGWHCTNRKLPVLFLSGGDDPCYVNVRRLKNPLTICG